MVLKILEPIEKQGDWVRISASSGKHHLYLRYANRANPAIIANLLWAEDLVSPKTSLPGQVSIWQGDKTLFLQHYPNLTDTVNSFHSLLGVRKAQKKHRRVFRKGPKKGQSYVAGGKFNKALGKEENNNVLFKTNNALALSPGNKALWIAADKGSEGWNYAVALTDLNSKNKPVVIVNRIKIPRGQLERELKNLVNNVVQRLGNQLNRGMIFSPTTHYFMGSKPIPDLAVSMKKFLQDYGTEGVLADAVRYSNKVGLGDVLPYGVILDVNMTRTAPENVPSAKMPKSSYFVLPGTKAIKIAPITPSVNVTKELAARVGRAHLVLPTAKHVIELPHVPQKTLPLSEKKLIK